MAALADLMAAPRFGQRQNVFNDNGVRYAYVFIGPNPAALEEMAKLVKMRTAFMV